jgi:prepilin peptidase CpaA
MKSPFEVSQMAIAAGVVFTAILAVAALSDIRTRRIPNAIVLSLAVLGLAFCVSTQGVLPGLTKSVEGMFVGLACWIPFYALGWLGAGDVKLYAAAGAWLGPSSAVEGALIGALAGAVLALLWMVKAFGVRQTSETLGLASSTPRILSPRQDRSGRSSRLPYGVAIAAGAICAGWVPGILFR